MEGAEVLPGEAPPASPGAAGEAQFSWTLYIGNLQAPDEGELQAFVQQHAPAPPTNVKVMRDKATGAGGARGMRAGQGPGRGMHCAVPSAISA